MDYQTNDYNTGIKYESSTQRCNPCMNCGRCAPI
jgi:hypothetical protein